MNKKKNKKKIIQLLKNFQFIQKISETIKLGKKQEKASKVTES